MIGNSRISMVCLLVVGACGTSEENAAETAAATDTAVGAVASASVGSTAVIRNFSAPVQPAQSGPDTVAGEYIVVLKPVVGGAQATITASEAVQRRLDIDSVPYTFTRVLTGFLATSVDSATLSRLRSDPSVARVVQNQRVYASTVVQDNAPWGLDRINQRGHQLDKRFSYDATGRGVDVYVFDTGIHGSHSEFDGGRARFWFDGVDTASKLLNDCHGHGTHVAATIAGRTFGVAKAANLFHARVLGCDGRGTWATVIAAMDSLTRSYQNTPSTQRRPTIVNMSLESSAVFDLAEETLRRSTAAGIVYVVAAGNATSDACHMSPTSTDNAIRVGASDQEDRRASFSNWGECVDLFAPGVEILSADPSGGTAAALRSGTSMSAPHVAGVVAQYLQLNPKHRLAAVRDALVKRAADAVADSKTDTSRLLFTDF
jgi:aqualysin 1